MPRKRTLTDEQRRDRSLIYYRAWCERNKERISQSQRNWQAKKREKRAARLRLWRRLQGPDGRKDYVLRKKYNITLDEWREMHKWQGYVCGMCGKSKPLHVDHDHKTGVVRGLLCAGCNSHIGWYELNKEKIKEWVDRGLVQFSFSQGSLDLSDRHSSLIPSGQVE